MTQRIMALGFLFMTCCASSHPKVIAHRGASGYLPEHSLPAVVAAHEMNVDFIEQDVVLSKDGVPVVLHDIHLETVTDVEQKFPYRARKDGRFYAIDLTFQELKQLDLHERTKPDGSPVFPKRFPVGATGMKIPSLDEEIALIKGLNKTRNKDIGLYIELKAPKFHNGAGFNMEQIVLDVVHAHGYKTADDNLYLQCFDPQSLKKLQKMTDLRRVQLVGLNSWKEADVDYEKMMTLDGLSHVATYAQGIGPFLGYFLSESGIKNKHLVDHSKELGLEVHAYTFRADQIPPGLESFDQLIDLFDDHIGVTGFFADHPDLVLKRLKR